MKFLIFHDVIMRRILALIVLCTFGLKLESPSMQARRHRASMESMRIPGAADGPMFGLLADRRRGSCGEEGGSSSSASAAGVLSCSSARIGARSSIRAVTAERAELASSFHERVPQSWTWFQSKQLKANLAAAIDALEAGISLSDLAAEDNPLVWLNRGFERINGYTREDAVGHNCRFLQVDATDPRAVAALRMAVQRGERRRVHLWNEGRSGGGYWSLVSLQPAVDEETVPFARGAGAGSSCGGSTTAGTSLNTSGLASQQSSGRASPGASPDGYTEGRSPPGDGSAASSRRVSCEENGGAEAGGSNAGGGNASGGGGEASGSSGARARYIMGLQLRLNHEEMHKIIELAEEVRAQNNEQRIAAAAAAAAATATATATAAATAAATATATAITSASPAPILPALRRGPTPLHWTGAVEETEGHRRVRRVSFESMGNMPPKTPSPAVSPRPGPSLRSEANAGLGSAGPVDVSVDVSDACSGKASGALLAGLEDWTTEFVTRHGRTPSVEEAMEAVRAALRQRQ